MIQSLQRLFESRLQAARSSPEADPREAVNLATASLLMEMVRSDFEVDAAEVEAVERAVRELIGSDEEVLEELLRKADRRAEESVSLYEFTRVLHQKLTPEEKLRVVEALWRVAFADGRLDDHEMHMMRKVRGLLHIPRKDFVAAKQRARGDASKS